MTKAKKPYIPSQGWISLQRDILQHWIFENPHYLKAWITILLTVNHAPRKVLLGAKVVECARGQSLLSLGGWAKLFGKGWSIQRVRTFFTLLKHDTMIDTETVKKSTRLTVCNYARYQNEQHDCNTIVTRLQHDRNTIVTTNNNDNNENNENKLSSSLNNYLNQSSKRFLLQKPKNKFSAEKNEFHVALKNIFSECYIQHTGSAFYWTAKEATALNALTKKIIFSIKSSGGEISQEKICATLTYILKNHKDKWINDNLSVSTINSKYNEIIAKIRTGSNGGSRISDEYKRKVADELLS